MHVSGLVRRPLVAAFGAFLAGILVAPSVELPAEVAVALAVAAIIGALVLAAQRRILALGAFMVSFVLAGVAVTGFGTARTLNTLDAGAPLDGRALVVEGVVVEAPMVGRDVETLVVELAATSTGVGGPSRPGKGRIQVRLPRSRHDVRDRADAGACAHPGDRVRIFARIRPTRSDEFPGDRATRGDLRRRGITLVGAAASQASCVRLSEAAAGDRVFERLRARLHEGIGRLLPEDRAALVRAFATGDRSGIDPDLARAFATSGLSHLLAVSGLNLAIVSGMFTVLLASLFTRIESIALGIGASRLSAIVALPFVLIYTLLVGATPSAVRAAIMVIALLVARMFGRPREPWSALALAGLAMVSWDPVVLEDASFQLSFAAVASLFVIYPALVERIARRLHAWPRVSRALFEALLASIAATLGTAPILAHHFGRLPILGLFGNIPAAPLSSLFLVPLSLVGGIVSLASDDCARPILAAAGWGVSLLAAIADGTARLPGAALGVSAPSLVECALFYAALTALSIRPAPPAMKKIATAAILLFGIEVGTIELFRRYGDSMVLTVLPVGQGDAIVAELPGGRVMVVDTGPGGNELPSAAERVILPYLRHRRIRKIDRVIITHPHADHAGGLEVLARELEVGEVWWNGDRREGPPEVLEALDRLGARILSPSAFTERVGPVTLDVLAPLSALDDSSGVNDRSIVLRFAIGRRAILLAGDAEAASEAAMLERCPACLRADVLKAGHHGSHTSSTQAFLRAVDPEHVVISLGRFNRFRFPDQRVLARIGEIGARIWRTDLNGAVTIETDGDGLSVRGYR